MPTVRVTAAGRGIGASIAKLAAWDGFDVAVNYRASASKVEEVAADIRAMGRRALAVQADISVEAEVVAIFETIDQKFGRLDALINNAAIDHSASVADSEIADLRRVLETNLIGTRLDAREAVRRMSTAIGRIAEPDEIAELAVWLAPDKASYVTATL